MIYNFYCIALEVNVLTPNSDKNSVVPCMNLITDTKTKRHKIKLKMLEGLFESCYSSSCSKYKKNSNMYELFQFNFFFANRK